MVFYQLRDAALVSFGGRFNLEWSPGVAIECIGKYVTDSMPVFVCIKSIMLVNYQ